MTSVSKAPPATDGTGPEGRGNTLPKGGTATPLASKPTVTSEHMPFNGHRTCAEWRQG